MKAFLQSPVGLIEIKETDGYISSVRIIHEEEAEESEASPLLNNAIKQLEEYFSGERKVFDLPLKQNGTPFQQKAWE